jgi:hypothetical protein
MKKRKWRSAPRRVRLGTAAEEGQLIELKSRAMQAGIVAGALGGKLDYLLAEIRGLEDKLAERQRLKSDPLRRPDERGDAEGEQELRARLAQLEATRMELVRRADGLLAERTEWLQRASDLKRASRD